MQRFPDASPWRKFNLRLTVLIIAAVLGGWAMTVFASKPSTVGAGGPAEASVVISPLDLMKLRGRSLPVTDYAEPF